eukprot:Phypoly_transcript_15827.p1 GENE.Phypoly_transcript_15827~~Phypoly_transcript_15827.p1  ORF type:complete len:192 (+),score=26.95 Phypoly_transcript_15827:207-782(+)
MGVCVFVALLWSLWNFPFFNQGKFATDIQKYVPKKATTLPTANIAQPQQFVVNNPVSSSIMSKLQQDTNAGGNNAAIIAPHSHNDESDSESTGPEQVELTGFEWLKHALQDPSVKKRRRTILVAFALLIAGTVLLLVGIIGGLKRDLPHSYISFFVIGIICFLPGIYYVYVVVKALRKVPGFTLEEVPDYD